MYILLSIWLLCMYTSYVSLVVVGEGGGGHGMFHIEGERIAWRSTKYLFFFTSAFQLRDNPWSQVSSLLPPSSYLEFYRAEGSAIPLLVDFPSSVS